MRDDRFTKPSLDARAFFVNVPRVRRRPASLPRMAREEPPVGVSVQQEGRRPDPPQDRTEVRLGEGVQHDASAGRTALGGDLGDLGRACVGTVPGEQAGDEVRQLPGAMPLHL